MVNWLGYGEKLAVTAKCKTIENSDFGVCAPLLTKHPNMENPKPTTPQSAPEQAESSPPKSSGALLTATRSGIHPV